VNVVRGRDQRARLDLHADVVVVGSGAGGAVVADVLARAGRSVVVVEEGDWVRPEEYGRLSPTDSMRRCWREGGMSAAMALGETPFISLLQGRCVGGSSVLTGGVCFRIPEAVLHEWSHDLGLATMTPENVDEHFRAVEQVVHVETGASRDAFAQHGALPGGRGQAGHHDEVDAAQHPRLPRRLALQLRLSARGEAERRRLVPTGGVRARRGGRQ
jgi:choline dehydrogenase-like flavoprotein